MGRVCACLFSKQRVGWQPGCALGNAENTVSLEEPYVAFSLGLFASEFCGGGQDLIWHLIFWTGMRTFVYIKSSEF